MIVKSKLSERHTLSRADRRRKRLRRAVSVLSIIVSFAILICSVTGSTPHTVAADSTRSALFRFDPQVTAFARVAPDTEPSSHSEVTAVPTASDFEAAFSKNFEHQDKILYVNNRLYSKKVILENDVIYVGIADFLYVLDSSAQITENASKVTADTGEVSLTAGAGSPYIVANGRYLWCHGGVKSENGVIMLPLSLICTVFGISRSSDGERISVTSGGTPIESGDSFYNKDSVYWLSRIISAESRGEPFKGKIAVGNVVLNRVRSKEFPNTVYGVIFDRQNGVQFTPAETGTVYNAPDADSVIAAKLCLEGVSLSNSILYFLNPGTATNFWITENRKYVTTIGSHKFYS